MRSFIPRQAEPSGDARIEARPDAPLGERCLECGAPCRLFFCGPCEQFLIENYMEETL